MDMTDGEIVVRTYRPNDRERLVLLGNNRNVAQYLADRFPFPYTEAAADDWLAAVTAETRPCNFAIDWNGEFVGGVGLMPLSDMHAGTAEIGYWLGEPYWGKGIATRAVRLVADYGLNELLFIRLQALVFASNPASMRVLEKNGFRREGVLRKHIRKFGRVHDAVLYAKLRNEA